MEYVSTITLMRDACRKKAKNRNSKLQVMERQEPINSYIKSSDNENALLFLGCYCFHSLTTNYEYQLITDKYQTDF